MRRTFHSLLIISGLFLVPQESWGSEWVFTTAGAEGRLGPTLSQVEAAYDQTNLSGKVAVQTQGIQQWSVPYTGRYRIIAYGARGGRPKDVDDKLRGKGVVWQGDFVFREGQKLNIVAGQEGIAKPGGNAVNGGGTGGGGSFVWLDGDIAGPLIVAGGG